MKYSKYIQDCLRLIVPEEGFEPPSSYEQQILNLSCFPFSPLRLFEKREKKSLACLVSFAKLSEDTKP